MKILITHVYANDNKGDAAILNVLVQELRKVFPQAFINIATLDNITEASEFEESKYVNSFMHYFMFSEKSRAIKGLYAFYCMLATILWCVIYTHLHRRADFLLPRNIKESLNDILTADLVVPIGGGYLRTVKSLEATMNLVMLLHPILLSTLLKKPIVLHSQSIGPFATPFQKRITRFVLNRTQGIIVREDRTLKTLEQIGVDSHLVIRSVDAGFLFRNEHPRALHDLVPALPSLKNKTLVGITVRNWMEIKKQERYEKEVARFVDTITRDGNTFVLFIPQVTADLCHDDDREVGKRIYALLQNRQHVLNLEEKYNHHEIKALYASLDYLVGTRFHSVIFSLTENVPALAIEYEYKTSGIMRDLGLSDWVIKIEDVNANLLIQKFEDLKARREEYAAILARALPPYITGAQETIHYVEGVYNASVGIAAPSPRASHEQVAA